MNKDKKQSLLKPYTNFDRIKDMTVDEMAEFLYSLENIPENKLFFECNYCKYQTVTKPYCRSCVRSDCLNAIKKYLKSKAPDKPF